MMLYICLSMCVCARLCGCAYLSLTHSLTHSLSLSRCAGADALIKLLKNYCRNKDLKTSIHVGVIGFPNVGKSSLINSLKRSKVCGVGATPGFTKTAQVRARSALAPAHLMLTALVCRCVRAVCVCVCVCVCAAVAPVGPIGQEYQVAGLPGHCVCHGLVRD
jgi:hypothetical protein